jgi:hypothetical protein
MSFIDDAERRIDEERQRAQQKKLDEQAKQRAKLEAEMKSRKRDNNNSLLW